MEYVSPQYQERLDELAERLMTDRFIGSLGAEAVGGMFVQDALDDELFETRAES